MSDPKPAEAKALAERLVAASSDLADALECATFPGGFAASSDHVAREAREAMNEACKFVLALAERITELEERLRSAELALCAYDDPTVTPGMARAHFAAYGDPPMLKTMHAAIRAAHKAKAALEKKT